MDGLVGVGLGINNDHYVAGRSAAKSALDQTKGRANLIILFSSFNLDLHKVLKGVLEETKDVPLIGCSSPKEIGPYKAQENSVVVMAISSALDIRIGLSRNFRKKAMNAGIELAASLIEGIKEPRGSLIILPDGVSGNGTELVKGIYSILGPNVDVVGGAAGDDLSFLKTYQFINGEVITDSVPGALILSSEKIMGIGIKHGFIPSGDPTVITKAEGNRIYELDGEPAFEVYLSYFGLKGKIKPQDFGKIPETHTHPLGSPQLHGEYLIRHFVASFDDGSIACSAELPPNSVVRVMEATKESLLSAAKEASLEAKRSLGEFRPKVVLIFNCISRVWILEDEADKEIDEIREVFGEDIPICGFYTYGEIGETEGPPLFHNKTVVVAAIR